MPNASPRRLRKALARGDVPLAPRFSAGASLLLLGALLPHATRTLTGWLHAHLEQALATPTGAAASSAQQHTTAQLLSAAPLLAQAASLLLGLLLACAALLLALQGAQGGLRPTWQRAPSANPDRWLNRALGLCAAAAALLLAGRWALERWVQWTLLTRASPSTTAHQLLTDCQTVIVGAGCVSLAIGLLEFSSARWLWRQRQRPTDEEHRREARDAEMAPELRAAQRGLQRRTRR